MLSCNFCLKNISQWSFAEIDVGTLSKGFVADVARFTIDRDGQDLFSAVSEAQKITATIVRTQPSSSVSSFNAPLSSGWAAIVTSGSVRSLF